MSLDKDALVDSVATETVADLLVLTRRFMDSSNTAGALAGASAKNAPAFLVDDRPAVAALAKMTLAGQTGGPTTGELEMLSQGAAQPESETGQGSTRRAAQSARAGACRR